MKIIAIALTGGISLAGIPSFFLAASADEPTIIEQECHRQLNLGPRGCSCIRERAEDILNKKQQRMVVALVRRDLAASDEMQSQMTAEEMAGAANFMMSAPRDCAEN